MLIIDGVKYKLWTPKDEEKEFHPMIKEYFKDIFGEDCIYFDVKQKLKSRAGIGSIPDAYVIKLSKPYEWYVIENELASHPIYDHIVKQLTKFMNGLRNPKSRSDILEALDEEVRNDKVLKAYIEKMIGSPETYRFMFKLLSRSPKIVVVIDELNEEVKEACESLKYHTEFVEFKTYVREDAENVKAHLFEPLHVTTEKKKIEQEIKMRFTPEKVVSVEQHFNKIKNEKIRKIAIELRDAIKSISGDIREGATREHITFWTGKSKFSAIFPEKHGFVLEVKVPRSEFTIESLNVSHPESTPKWSTIHVDENTNLSSLIDASRQAYESTKRNVER